MSQHESNGYEASATFAGPSNPLGGMDSAKVAGALVIGALIVLAVLNASFGGLTVRVGD